VRLGEIVRDVTELDEAQAALKRSHAELQQFAYTVSHDLQEPLRMVREFMRLLRQRYAGQLDDVAQEYIAYAVDGATRMQEMIQALLLYARVHTQGRELAPTDCEALLAQALSDLQFRIEDVGAQVTHEPLPTVMGDDLQLGRVFQNLLSNALKFQPARQRPHVHISAARQGEMWRLAVRDNGIGIAPQDMENLFQVFSCLHDRKVYAGTGIGLATCRRIIARHGGRIWAESTPGEGSTFYFTLPAVGE
jgi:light-regulated signal transduction histidine kinase (bacteriophytochrome)